MSHTRAIYQALPFCSFFQKVPFDKVGYYLRNENEKFLFFLNDIKKTCAARGSFRSLRDEGTYSNVLYVIIRQLERIHCDVKRGCNMERSMDVLNVTTEQQQI